MTDTTTKRTGSRGGDPGGFTAEEKAAMQERARELKAAKGKKVDGAADLRAKIEEMTGTDREMAERIDAIVREVAPQLEPRTWYGMPAYSLNGKVLCYFQSAAKFKARYATFGFDETARIDEGSMWPTAWALTKLTKEDEDRIRDLIRKAVGG